MSVTSQKGVPFRHVIREFESGGREWSYHETKGWRSRAVVDAANPLALPYRPKREPRPRCSEVGIRMVTHTRMVRGEPVTSRVPVVRVQEIDYSRYTGEILREIRAGRKP